MLLKQFSSQCSVQEIKIINHNNFNVRSSYLVHLVFDPHILLGREAMLARKTEMIGLPSASVTLYLLIKLNHLRR